MFVHEQTRLTGALVLSEFANNCHLRDFTFIRNRLRFAVFIHSRSNVQFQRL